MNRQARVLLQHQSYIFPLAGDLDFVPELLSTQITGQSPLGSARVSMQSQKIVFPAADQSEDFEQLLPAQIVLSPVENKAPKKKNPSNATKTYTIKERIEQVQNGSYIHLCISSPTQDMTRPLEVQDERGQFAFTIHHNYKPLDNASLEMINDSLIKKQKQVLGYIIKQFGSALVSGKSIMSISLPIVIFEPRSLLERLADSFAFAPQFLEKAGQTKDTLEQFKLALTFYLTTLAADLNPEKPFNPVLGETFQGIIGGCPIYLEQISHHPPIAAFQMLGKNFSIQGSFEFYASVSTNSVKCRKIGDFKVIFKNTGSVIQAQFPFGVMSGTSFGKRIWQYSKKLQVYDFKNKYYTEIDFDKTDAAKKRKDILGYFISNLYQVTDKFAAKTLQEITKQKDIEIKFKEKDHTIAKLDKIEGSWFSSLSINDKMYWSHANPWPYKVQYFDNPIPSDCNFRSDLLYLKSADENKAQASKLMLEEAQRKDQKLREQKKSKRYH